MDFQIVQNDFWCLSCHLMGETWCSPAETSCKHNIDILNFLANSCLFMHPSDMEHHRHYVSGHLVNKSNIHSKLFQFYFVFAVFNLCLTYRYLNQYISIVLICAFHTSKSVLLRLSPCWIKPWQKSRRCRGRLGKLSPQESGCGPVGRGSQDPGVQCCYYSSVMYVKAV